MPYNPKRVSLKTFETKLSINGCEKTSVTIYDARGLLSSWRNGNTANAPKYQYAFKHEYEM